MTVCCGPERLGQKLAGPGHDLCRGPAPLHRIAVGLCPAVPRPDAEAEGRARQRPVAGHQHRAEDHQQESALDGRHGDGGLRLPAHPLRPAGPTVLSGLRHPRRHADGRRDHRQDPVPAGGDQAVPDGARRTPRAGEVRGALGRDPPQRLRAACAWMAGRTTSRNRRPSTTAASTRSRWSWTASWCAAASAAGWPTPWRRPWTWAAASCTSPTSTTDRDEPHWKVDRYSQHFACDRCGRSFEPLNPHHFSFNSPLGWCPTCEGLGVQKGANPAAPDPRSAGGRCVTGPSPPGRP